MSEKGIEKQPAWWLVLLQGVAAVVLGVLFLKSPASSLLGLTLFLGAYWLARGILGIIEVGIGPRFTIGWRLFASVMSIIAGGLVLAYPITSAAALPVVYVIVLGVDALISGGTYIAYGVTGAGAGAVVLGVFDALIGALLLIAPYQAALAVPYLIGTLFILGGVAVVGACLWIRSQEHHASHEMQAA